MKSKSIKLLFVLLVVSVLSMCAVGSDGEMGFRRQQIEHTYISELDELYQEAERYARKMSATDRLPWVVTSSSSSTVIMQDYSLQAMTEFLLDEEAYGILSGVVNVREQDASVRRQALRMLRIKGLLKDRAVYLQANRETDLATLYREEVRHSKILSEPLEVTQSQDVTRETGVVSAISYSAKGSICMVEGVDEILSAGDVINTENIKGVKVVSISRNSVQFSRKRGKAWTQVLDEEANSRMID